MGLRPLVEVLTGTRATIAEACVSRLPSSKRQGQPQWRAGGGHTAESAASMPNLAKARQQNVTADFAVEDGCRPRLKTFLRPCDNIRGGAQGARTMPKRYRRPLVHCRRAQLVDFTVTASIPQSSQERPDILLKEKFLLFAINQNPRWLYTLSIKPGSSHLSSTLPQ